jgi:streptomycin 6-kinase
VTAFAIPRGREWWRSTPQGAAWLEELPRLVAACSRDWQLVVRPPFDSGSVSWVAPAELRDGTRAVLKVKFPDADSEHEADALVCWSGKGAVRVLAHDRSRGAVLMERCDPGLSLWSIPDEVEAARLAANVLRLLWTAPAPDAPFRSLEGEAQRWAESLPLRWARHGQPCSRRVLGEAVSLCAELGGSMTERVVCHQDFHGGNVLLAGDERWLAIDPKPLVGERAFDLALLLRDRRSAVLGTPHPERALRRRLDMLVDELDVNRARARGWGIVHALAWSLSDEAIYPDLVAMAELLASVP